MAKNLTLQGVLKLQTDAFKRGINEARKSLNLLRNSFAALAGSIGIGFGLGATVKDLASLTEKLNQAKTLLKNVSSDSMQYVDNWAFLQEISAKYNQDLITLVRNFAQFKSAADGANVAIDDQRKIFDAMSRAAAYFGMSQQSLENSMVAIQQMMSKGKVSSEELRRQLGNNLPGAFTLMARAAGVSVGELEDLMRKGQVLSADVLPKFADELNKITKNVDVNTIAGLKNVIQNQLTNLANQNGLEDVFKRVLKLTSQLIGNIQHIINMIGSGIAGAFLGKGLSAMTKFFKTNWDLASESRKKISEIVMGRRKEWADSVRKLQKMVFGGHDGYLRNKPISFDRKTGKATLKDGANIPQKELENAKKLVEEYNKSVDASVAKINELKKTTNGWNNVLGGIGNTLEKVFSTVGPMALIAVVVALVNHFTELYKEANRVKKIFEETVDTFGNYSGTNGTIEEVESIRRKLNGLKTDSQKAKDLMAELADFTGFSTDEMNKQIAAGKSITQIVNEQLGLLKDKSKLEAEYTDLVEKRVRLREIESQLQKKDNGKNYFGKSFSGYFKNPDSFQILGGAVGSLLKGWSDTRELKNLQTEAENLRKSISYLEGSVDELSSTIKDNAEESRVVPKSAEEETYGDIYSNYMKEKAILDTKKAHGLFKSAEHEYEKELQKLVSTTIDKILDESDSELREQKISTGWGAELISLFKKLDSITGKGQDSELKKALDKYSDGIKELNAQLKNGYLSQSQYDQKLNDLNKDSWEAISGIDNLDAEIAKLGDTAGKTISKIKNDYLKGKFADAEKTARANAYNNYAQDKEDFGPVKDKYRDTTFDYSKTRTEQIEESYDLEMDYIDRIADKINDLAQRKITLLDGTEIIDPKALERIDELKKQLADATIQAGSMADALRLSKIQDDIKEYEKELRSGVFGSISDVASATDRLVDGFRNIRETMQDTDSTGFEKLLAIINEIIQSVETVATVIKGVQEAIEVASKLAGAKAALTIPSTEAQAVSEAALGKIAMESAMEYAMAKRLEASAAKDAAVAGAMAGSMSLPYPANIAALSHSMAAITAALAAGKGLQAFANGGAVGGSKGEHPILSHAGEIVLSESMQRNLAGKIGAGGQVEFKIRGQELWGVLQSYDKTRRGGH